MPVNTQYNSHKCQKNLSVPRIRDRNSVEGIIATNKDSCDVMRRLVICRGIAININCLFLLIKCDAAATHGDHLHEIKRSNYYSAHEDRPP